jgi:nucleoside-diphosphate-sugar epimerase
LRVTVTGGTGFIGSSVVELLLAEGHEVSCLVLPGAGRGWLGDKPLRFVEGDILDADSMLPALQGSEAVIHLAGITRGRSEEDFVSVNVEGTRVLLEAARSQARSPHVILMSSLAAVGPCSPGGTHDEDAPLRPITAYGRSKAALEELARSYGDSVPWTAIRAPGVYGPRDRDFLGFFRLARRGLRIVTRLPSVVSLVYVKTLARAIVSCIRRPSAYGNAFFIADDGTCDWDQLQGMIASSLKARTRRICLPEWVFSAICAFSGFAKHFSRQPQLLSRDKLLEMREARWVVSTDKAKQLLGFRPLLSTRSAIAETCDWYRAAGWI